MLPTAVLTDRRPLPIAFTAGRAASIALIALCGLVLAGAGDSFAAEADDRLLERVDARTHEDTIEIVVSTTQRLRYVSHTVAEDGRVLQVQLVPEGPAAPGTGFNLLPWTGSAQIPVQDVSSETSVSTASVALHFSIAVKVREVRANPDDRNLVVLLDTPRAIPAPAPGGPGIFVINLASWGAEGTVDPAIVKAAGPGITLYQVRTRALDSVRYRLRAGFFDSAGAAEAAVPRFAEHGLEAWVSQVTAPERDAAQGGSKLIDLSQLMIRAESDTSLADASIDRLTELMEEARTAVAAADWTRAGLLYERVSAYPVAPYQQDARELAGVVREKAGQLAQAAVLYRDYLQRYPSGEGADRVSQRLAALDAPPPISALPATGRQSGLEGTWDTYGSFTQYYAHDLISAGDQSNENVRSLLSNDLDLSTRRRADSGELRFRFSGGYDRDFLDRGESEWHVSTAYADFASRDQTHVGRLGRQTRSSGGILGRFDGLHYGYRIGPKYRLNVVGGFPVDFSSGKPDTDRLFYGLNLDLSPDAERWNFNLFAINQTADGVVDRRAVGTEMRYAHGNSTAFALFDYDLEFQTRNVLYVIGSTTFGDSTTISIVADQRKNPPLSASNALVGQTATTLDDLGGGYTEEELRRLALDRTATSTTYSGALTQVLTERWRLSADVTVTELSGTSASEGVEAFPESGPDWYYNLQMLGTDLFRPEDYGSMGLRYTDATSYESIAVLGQYRLRFGGGLLLNPRLRVDRRRTQAGATQWLYVPALRATQALGRKLTLEFEASAEVLNEHLDDISDETRLYLFYLGYRYEF